MRKHERVSVLHSQFAVTIHVADVVVSTGGTIIGHVKPRGNAVAISLVRLEQGGEVRQQAKAASALSDPDTGAFELIVPRRAQPTVGGQGVNVRWRLDADRHPSVRIEVKRDPQAAFTNFYATGEAPRVMAELSRRNHEYIYAGAILFGLFIYGFFYIEQVSREASTFGRVAALGTIVAFALTSLALLLLAAGTRWPRIIRGFEPVLTPDVVEQGGVVELATSQQTPKSLRLLCIESYGEVVERGNNLEGVSKVPVMRQHTHPPIWPVPSSDGCSFQVPDNALPSVRVAAGDVMWVVRQGGKTIGPWGPFRYRDWGVVVR